jgi:predicted CXXCH cytochrome family protein
VRFTVGRGQTADFTLKDLRVSRIHFTIEQTPTAVTLIDDGSLNGTFVNDNPERVTRTTLRHGDIISICDTRLQIEIPSQGETTSLAPLPPRSLPSTRRPPPKEREAVVVSQRPALPVPTPITVSLPSRWQAVFVGLLLTALCGGGVLVLGKPTLFSSGPLSSSHAPWEGECATCHAPWGNSQALSTSCAADNCHANVVQTNTRHQDDCTTCHTEHRGPMFNIKGEVTQCWGCHEAAFQERPLWRHYKQVFIATGNKEKRTIRLALPTTEAERRRWQQSAPYDESGLIFAHAAHAQSSGQPACLACHQPLPGTVINALGSGSAFPSHDDCIDCHKEVGSRDPQLATASASAQCRKCHTREDSRVIRRPRTLPYVEFSHDNHKTTDCVQCHFTISGEQTYRPVLRSAAYLLPMEACVSCHEQQRAATTCLSCHRAHHSVISTARTDGGFLTQIDLPDALFALLVFEVGISASVYWWRREM